MAELVRGLEGIIANTTRLSDVIGDKGQLIYCGYDINELAGNVSYEEVVHLLWHNRLPTEKELDKLTSEHVDEIDRALDRKEHELLEV